jgi:hypothetical protein
MLRKLIAAKSMLAADGPPAVLAQADGVGFARYVRDNQCSHVEVG